ncbi:hypothetical protein BSL90_07210 [Listeria monocytogenes]|nr:hypothetical protein [Listeria monocytogenes]EAK8400085.1 hypothetical protein [Listeria monocytogenes]EIL9238504.1 hypothetical protein [Listeria monocytogenes]
MKAGDILNKTGGIKVNNEEKIEAMRVEKEIRELKRKAMDIGVNNLEKYIENGHSAMVAAIAEILK